MAEAVTLPPARTALADPLRLPVAFAHVLRRWGLAVPVGRLPLFAAALGSVGVSSRSAVYWAGRATLVTRPEDIGAYDGAFAQFWEGGPPPTTRLAVATPVIVEAPDQDGDGPTQGDDPDRTERNEVVRYSAVETLRDKDFAAYSDEDFEAARRLMAALRLRPASRPSRRLRPARGGTDPDLRRTVQRALRTSGEAVSIARRAPRTQPRRLVLLCDISGSMEPYSRALLRFAQAAVVGRPRVEVFSLGTRLSRLTRQLSARDPDAALAAAARVVADWSGGTRLGDGLRTFNDRWGVRGMARGAIVVILSDGWDRGDPAELAEQMARLRRVARKVVWVNPLKAAPGYAPLARGMAAALPYVDAFVEGHSLAALEHLAEVVGE
ncbi:MAG TPA: VWA domain-containing protein [Acidimicrobiales bacterium]|nr:VWA domain-containing protein [Acidimicrobiales bacterium]